MGDAKVGPFLPGARVTCVMLFITRGQSPFLIGLRCLVQFQRSLLGVLVHEVRSLAREARGHHVNWFAADGDPCTSPRRLHLVARRTKFLCGDASRRLIRCEKTCWILVGGTPCSKRPAQTHGGQTRETRATRHRPRLLGLTAVTRSLLLSSVSRTSKGDRVRERDAATLTQTKVKT